MKERKKNKSAITESEKGWLCRFFWGAYGWRMVSQEPSMPLVYKAFTRIWQVILVLSRINNETIEINKGKRAKRRPFVMWLVWPYLFQL